MDNSQASESNASFVPRKLYFPSLPLTECTKEGKPIGQTFATNRSTAYKLKQAINPLQQLILEQANRALQQNDPAAALDQMVYMKGCLNKPEKMALIRMHLLTLLSYKQITPERCVTLLKTMERQCGKEAAVPR